MVRAAYLIDTTTTAWLHGKVRGIDEVNKVTFFNICVSEQSYTV
jgi:hypothetical protein